MQKLIFSLAVATLLIACDNAGDGATTTRDSLDSVANAKKDRIDSTAEMRKDVIDSTTQRQKDALEDVDSMNRRKDSVTR